MTSRALMKKHLPFITIQTWVELDEVVLLEPFTPLYCCI